MFVAASLFSWNHVHPVLVHFSTALLPASLVSDVLGKYFNRSTLSSAAWWMILYAAVATPATVLAGWMWSLQFPPSAVEGLPGLAIHKWLGISLAAVFMGLAIWRGTCHANTNRPDNVYLLITTLAVAGLMYQGFLGGQMTIG